METVAQLFQKPCLDFSFLIPYSNYALINIVVEQNIVCFLPFYLSYMEVSAKIVHVNLSLHQIPDSRKILFQIACLKLSEKRL